MNKSDTFVIQGLAGKKNLRGTVRINGAKNSTLKAMAAAILFDGPVTLENVPDNSDIQTLKVILEKLGAKVERDLEAQKITIDSAGINSTDIDPELAKGMRGSVVLTGPMLGRFDTVNFPAPGGCVIGARPIDRFLSGYKKMGATVDESEENFYKISAKDGLKAAEITFEKISVGATETLMMAAVLAKGKTVLKNCAREPEIGNVAEWLNACGAKIRGVGTSEIEIEGTGGKLLSSELAAQKPFVTIPDRITAGSFLILGALCAEELKIEKCEPKHLGATIDILSSFNVKMDIGTDSIIVSARKTEAPIDSTALKIRTLEYPGFPTDLQAPLAVFLTQMEGEFTLTETIFEGRFKYIEDLIRLGARITTVSLQEIMISGPVEFGELANGEELTAHDIRAGFAVVLAALLGRGESVIGNVHLIDRGYEKLEEVLSSLGASVKRV